ncbi:MAG TPA: SpoIID/LytB domain-containing protein [Acidimicrobiales bacterium]|nr:SpoIID/LytB domain-containing protein [Acidimicrobiales bacterium]
MATIGGIHCTPPRRRRVLRRVAPALLSLGLSGVIALAPAAPAAAYPFATVSLTGHGFGSGSGMGQWGALGYALQGLSWAQILSTYYGTATGLGATTVGALPNGWSDTSPVTVALTANAGNDVIVTSNSAFLVDGAMVPAGSGARFQLTGPGNWAVYTSPGGCGGNGNWGAAVANVANPVAAPVSPSSEPFPSDGNLANEALQLCLLPHNITVRGSLEGTVNTTGSPRTVNVLALGQYVADVTPSESPASWAPLGGGAGANELWAQAVAVRSYVMSTYGNLQGYFGYADICDNGCQSYLGITNESTATDTATTGTANTVVLMPNGTVARTQYSSSTGGYSAGGTFAAVPDLGDSVCVPGACNPHHTWQAQVPVSAIDAAYPQIGTLVSVGVSQRNNLGDLSGRVLQMTLQGSAQSVTISGDTFASQFAQYGLQSNWFSVSSQASGGVGGYWLVATDGGVFSFGDAVFHGSAGNIKLTKPVVGMASTPDGGGYWLVASDGGVFSYGDAVFHGSTGALRLAQPMTAMASTPDGGGYWLVASDGGVFSFANAPFEGSLPGVGVHAPGVALLPTATGAGYLIVTTDGRAFGFGDAPQFGDVADVVMGYSGHLVGGATVSG